MNNQVQESLIVLSENIAKTARDKTIKASITALNSVGEAPLNSPTDDLMSDLTKYIHENITAEFGRLLALIEASKDKVDGSVQQALHEVVRGKSVAEIGLSANATLSLEMAGWKTIGELLDANPVDVMDTPAVGVTAKQRISDFLHLSGINWPGNIPAEQIKARRYERLDELSLSQLVAKTGYTKGNLWQISSVPRRDLREYRLKRVSETPDQELYPYGFNDLVYMFGKVVLWELSSAGIKTFGDLLPLTSAELTQRIASKKYADQEPLLRRINSSLELIGREIK